MSEPSQDNLPVDPVMGVDSSSLAKAEVWQRENAVAIAERRAWIERHHAPLADIQVLKGL